MGLVDLMLKEAKKYVKPEINREAAGFLLNLNYSVSALLTGDKQKEFDALVGISYKKTVTCTLCQYFKTLQISEHLMQLPVPKKREINIEEEVAKLFKAKEKVVVVPSRCFRPKCGGQEAYQRLTVSQLPQVLILAFNREDMHTHQIKPFQDFTIKVQGQKYWLTSALRHNGNEGLTSGHFYADLLERGEERWRIWRCDQEDGRGSRVIQMEEFFDTLNLGNVYIFVMVPDDEEIEESPIKTRFGPSLSQDFPSLVAKTPVTLPRKRPQPASASGKTSDLLGSIDRDLRKPHTLPQKKSLRKSPLAKDIPGAEGEARLKERQRTRCHKCWRIPTAGNCGLCKRLLCFAHVRACYMPRGIEKGRQMDICHDCMKTGNWKLDWKNNNHRNMVLNDEGSLLLGHDLFDCLEDNGQNQLPKDRPNIGWVRDIEEGLEEVKAICMELQFEGGAEADQTVDSSWSSYESDISQASGRDSDISIVGECEVILSRGGDQHADNMDTEPGESALMEEADIIASSNPGDLEDYHYEEDYSTEDENLSTSNGQIDTELDSKEEPETNAANDESTSRARTASFSSTSGSDDSKNRGLKLVADMDMANNSEEENLRVARRCSQKQHHQPLTDEERQLMEERWLNARWLEPEDARGHPAR